MVVAISTLAARQPAWKDPTRHSVQFVTVDQGVRLEVLDWGGTGPPVVLLTRSGHTAHVYDDQRLADDVFPASEGGSPR